MPAPEPFTNVLHLTRGLPGSGKSTFARAWVAEDPTSRARLNRDDFRHMLFNADAGGLTAEQEQLVTLAQHAAVRSLLASGIDVIVDDTNLNHERVHALAWIAGTLSCRVEMHAEFLTVPLATCIERDRARPAGRGHVGAAVITGMFMRYLAHPVVGGPE